MNYDVVVFAQVAVVNVGFVGSLATIGVLTTLAIRRSKRTASPIASSDQRLEELQRSVDAIAVEVERIAEAQRFSAKLLAERRDTSSVPR